MQIDEAAKILAKMYSEASSGEKVVAIHLFGIKFAEKIRNISPKDIAILAEIPKSYGTEIRKGINLAKYVKFRDL